MATSGMSMKTAGYQVGAVQASSTVSFDDMASDLRALYSGKTGQITVNDLVTDIQALYPSEVLPIRMNDLVADLRELYGDQTVAWADFIADFESLYDVHHLI